MLRGGAAVGREDGMFRASLANNKVLGVELEHTSDLVQLP